MKMFVQILDVSFSFHIIILMFADREYYIGSQLIAFLWIVGFFFFFFLDYTADFQSFS